MGGEGWPADSGLWVGSVEDPDPRSWYVMNSVYFEYSVSRTCPSVCFAFRKLTGLFQLKRWANLRFVY